jgi:nucleoside-diphosphate-sugar epimerase
LAELIARLTEFEGMLRVVWDTTKPNAPSVARRTLGVDTSRAKQKFGFESRVPFEHGLRETIECAKHVNSRRV